MSTLSKRKLKEIVKTAFEDGSGTILKKLLPVVIERTFYSEQIAFVHLGKDYFTKLFRNIPNKLSDRSYLESLGLLDNNSYYDFFIYNNIPIIANIILRGDGGNVSVSLSVPRTKNSIKTLKRFISYLSFQRKQHILKTASKRAYAFSGDSEFMYDVQYHKRDMSTLYIKESQAREFESHIKHFIDRKSWFEKYQIPHHTGILLYGPPGTGKSSFVSAVCDKFNLCRIYVDSVNGIANIEKPLRNTYGTDSGDIYTAVIVEDCDILLSGYRSADEMFEYNEYCVNSEKDKAYVSKLKESNLSKLLNAIDGACSCTDIIYIFTTNYPERIDPRFLRAGRIDKQIEIGYVCDEVMNQCLNAHFGKGLPEDRTTAESVTIAQMNIDLMSEATYEQIVEKYTIKKLEGN